MNKFEGEFWNGAREAALAIHTYVGKRTDLPRDVHDFIESVLRATGERKNRDFREALGLVAPEPA